LPDLLVPYRRHESASIERALEDPAAAGVAVDESTLYRWRQWFAEWVIYAVGCLTSMTVRFQGDVRDLSGSAQSGLQQIGQFVGTYPFRLLVLNTTRYFHSNPYGKRRER
jgi:hypothetical protein